MMYKKIALCFLFFSGKAFCMLVNPVRKTWNDQFFTQKLIPNALPIIMNHLDFNSTVQFLATCTYLHQAYGDKGFTFSPEAYMKEMIHVSRAGDRERVKLLIKREDAVHKRQRESLLQYFNVNCYNIAALMGIYKKAYNPKCTNFMRLETEIKVEDLVSNPLLCQLSLEQGLSPNIDYVDDTLLICAVKGGNSKVVKLLLGHEEIDPNKENKNGNPPLLVAIEKGDPEVIKLLLDHKKIEPNKVGAENLYAPLHLAVSRRNLEAIKLLLDHEKIEPNKENKNYHTPLHYAIDKDLEAATELLLGHKKIDPNKGNIYGTTPLHWVISKKRNLKLVKCLLRHPEIDPNKKDGTHQTPFHSAISFQNLGAIELLLDHVKFDPDQENKDGQTSLLYAANNGAPNVKTLERLLDKSKGANFFWYNFHHYESHNKSLDISSLLPTKCTSYKARFFYCCGYMAGSIRRNILNRVVGTTSRIGNIINGAADTTNCIIADTTFSGAAIALVAYCCKAAISSSLSKK